MSNFVGNRPNLLSAAIQGIKKIVKGGEQKTTGTGAITTTNISKNLKEFAKQKEDVIKTTDKYTKGLTEEGKINVKKHVAPALSKISRLTQRLPVKKAEGGRIGLKLGTNPFARKSNIKKIQETFGPKQVKKKQKPKVRMMAKKGAKPKKKFPDLNKDGKVTFADVLKGRGVINGKKKQKKKII